MHNRTNVNPPSKQPKVQDREHNDSAINRDRPIHRDGRDRDFEREKRKDIEHGQKDHGDDIAHQAVSAQAPAAGGKCLTAGTFDRHAGDGDDV